MKFAVKITPAIFFVVVPILFSACIKEYDYVKQHPGAEVKGCRIKFIVRDADTFYVHYNAAGDPTDLVEVHLHPGGSWQGDYHFRYDKYHRLTDYFWGEPALTDYRLIWHRYTYFGKSIVTDSLFAYINNGSGPNPPLENFDALTIDSLDAEGRIVKVTEPGNPPYIAYYRYNAKGNLDAYNAAYDNELNIYHTSRVWMFIENDYSVNNQLNYGPVTVQITSYNAAGLPLLFQVAPNSIYPYGGELFGGSIIYSKLQVEYDCDPVNTGL